MMYIPGFNEDLLVPTLQVVDDSILRFVSFFFYLRYASSDAAQKLSDKEDGSRGTLADDIEERAVGMEGDGARLVS